MDWESYYRRQIDRDKKFIDQIHEVLESDEHTVGRANQLVYLLEQAERRVTKWRKCLIECMDFGI